MNPPPPPPLLADALPTRPVGRRWHSLVTGRRSRALILLAALSVVSFGARIAWIGEPCRAQCNTASGHVLIFDERYYVNAARVIAGLHPPAGSPYAGLPAGVDPNSEHPQLVKLVMAGAIERFGDGPFAWRIGSILAGSIAILGMFALVLAAGGTECQALGASTLMALDTMLLVNSRIGTLDVSAVAAAVWAGALYLRGRPLAAGGLVALGACAKEVASFVLLAFALIELFRWVLARGGAPQPWSARLATRRLAFSITSAATVFLGLLDLLDRIAPPYDPGTHKLLGRGPLQHVAHILSYASRLTSPHAPKGIASYPWQWLVDYKPISYLVINPSKPVPGLAHVHPAVHFLGLINPPILLAALAGLVAAGTSVLRRRSRRRPASGSPDGDALAIFSLAWVAGTWIPFMLLSLIASRTSYLYYMTLVMPGMYTAVVHLTDRHRPGRRLAGGFAVLVLLAAIALYPFTPLPFGW
jgi:dolichyl-phosphate-mannose--protein O-mannosyl transferase